MDLGTDLPLWRDGESFAIENEKRVVGGITDLDFDAVRVDGTNARVSYVMGSIKKWRKGKVGGSGDEQRVYQDIRPLQRRRAGRERKKEGRQDTCRLLLSCGVLFAIFRRRRRRQRVQISR